MGNIIYLLINALMRKDKIVPVNESNDFNLPPARP